MNKFIIILLLLPACNERQHLLEDQTDNFTVKMAKLEAEILKQDLEYQSKLSRVIPIEVKNLNEKNFEKSLSINYYSVICEDNGYSRTCYASTDYSVQVHYHCMPTLDSYKCRLD